MLGKMTKKWQNQAGKLQSTSLMPIANIKTEKVDGLEEVVGNRSTTMRPLAVTIKKEKPDSNNNTSNARRAVNSNNHLCINIKTEKSNDDDNDSVIFVPNPTTTVIVINDSLAPPPRKKTKLNNGNVKSKNTVVKKELLSPVRNRNRNNSYRARNNSNQFHNHNNNNTTNNINNYWPNRSYCEKSQAASDKILRNLKLSPSELRLLTLEHRQKIIVMFNFLWYQAENECNQDYVERLVVAKIRVVCANLKLEQVYRTLRRDMVGWIERYQSRCHKTPRYYSVFIDRPFVIVMCADSAAYNCLCDYINNTYATSTYRKVNIEFLPRYNGRTLYCYAVTADDLVYDTERFLRQLHFHISSSGGSAVYADKWILARHHIHKADGFTSFVFLMDYISHLTLEYVYKNSLTVCMLAVKFSYRGIAPCNF